MNNLSIPLEKIISGGMEFSLDIQLVMRYHFSKLETRIEPGILSSRIFP